MTDCAGARHASGRAPAVPTCLGLGLLAVLFNAILLIMAVGIVAWEAVLRLLHPAPVTGTTVRPQRPRRFCTWTLGSSSWCGAGDV